MEVHRAQSCTDVLCLFSPSPPTSSPELVDCDGLDHACGGGLPSNAYEAIESLGEGRGLRATSERHQQGWREWGAAGQE